MKSYEALYQTILLEHKKVFEAQSTEELDGAMREIASAKRIFITGAGREGIASRGFAMRLMHLGKETHWLWDDTTPGMKAGDLFIAVNGSGCIGHIDYLLDQAPRMSAHRPKQMPVSSFLQWYTRERIHVLFRRNSRWEISSSSISFFSLISWQSC